MSVIHFLPFPLLLPSLHRKTPPSFPPKPFLSIPITTTTRKLRTINPLASSFSFSLSDDFENALEDVGTPWEGAVVYRRDGSVSHVEYCTTLERLGLGKISSVVSRAQAKAMGIRVPVRKGSSASNRDDETPVLISVDVTRRPRMVRLDGIVRTVISLHCNRCTEPAAECVFSNFTILLSEDPIEEPDEINMGVIYGEDKVRRPTGSNDEDDEQDIDIEDQLFFPSELKEIDISKNIRDVIHVEITINAICDASCKGLCLKCGTNLNKSTCNCSKTGHNKPSEFGPLNDLKRQMQQR